MTPQEHRFMLMLYTHQQAKIKLLEKALKASGTLSEDDLTAYQSYAVHEQPEELREWAKQAYETYQSAAEGLGIDTGLKDDPSLRD
jgi:hypothetical protein